MLDSKLLQLSKDFLTTSEVTHVYENILQGANIEHHLLSDRQKKRFGNIINALCSYTVIVKVNELYITESDRKNCDMRFYDNYEYLKLHDNPVSQDYHDYFEGITQRFTVYNVPIVNIEENCMTVYYDCNKYHTALPGVRTYIEELLDIVNKVAKIESFDDKYMNLFLRTLENALNEINEVKPLSEIIEKRRYYLDTGDIDSEKLEAIVSI